MHRGPSVSNNSCSLTQDMNQDETGRIRGNAAASFAKLHVQTHPLRGWLDVLIQAEPLEGKHVHSSPKPGTQRVLVSLDLLFGLQLAGWAAEWTLISRHCRGLQHHVYMFAFTENQNEGRDCV